MYTEPLEKEDLKKESAWHKFDMFLKEVLSPKKHKRISQFIRYPLNAVDICESTLTDILKVFDASNSYFDFETENESQILEQKVTELNIIEFIKRNGRSVLKNKPNTFVVLDKDENGEEYFLTIDNDRIIDFDTYSDDTIEYISFCHSTILYKGNKSELISFYCDEYYRVFIKDGENYLLYEKTEIAHDLGECPARMFMTDKISDRDCYNRRIPLTSALSKIEEWQIFDIYKFYSDHYGPFPVIEKGEDNCSVEGCDGGVIPREDEYYEEEVLKMRTVYTDCQVCKNKSLVGPGTVVEIPLKGDKDDPSQEGYFKFIAPDIGSLTYIANKLTSLEDYVYLKTVGTNTLLDNEAVNVKQVQGSFESKKSVLMKLKPNFDNLYKWMVTILAKSVNGKDAIIIVHGDFGTDFHLVTEEDIQTNYTKAKTAGMPDVEVDTIYLQLINTKYKSNPEMTERMWLIKMLDPAPHDNFDLKAKKFAAGVMSEEEFHISTRILSFVERFELENTDLVSFGKKLPLRSKIEKILTTFKLYANEYISVKQVQRSKESGLPNEGGQGAA